MNIFSASVFTFVELENPDSKYTPVDEFVNDLIK